MPLTKALNIEFLPMVALAKSRAEAAHGDACGVNDHPTCIRSHEIHDALKAPPDKRHAEDGSATKFACKEYLIFDADVFYRLKKAVLSRILS
jgi:hypothetical protein